MLIHISVIDQINSAIFDGVEEIEHSLIYLRYCGYGPGTPIQDRRTVFVRTAACSGVGILV